MLVEPKTILSRLTPTAHQAVNTAAGQAIQGNFYEIIAEHVLAVLLEGQDGDAARILHHFGQDQTRLFQRVAKVLQTMRTGQSRYGAGDLLSVPAIRKDGSRLSVEFTILPLHGPDGRIEGIAAVMRDITPRFEELRALRRRVAELEAGQGGQAGGGKPG